MKIIIIGSNGLAGSAFMRILPGLGYDCIPVSRENYAEVAGTECDILINANGNSAKYLAARDPLGEIDRSVSSVMRSCLDFKTNLYIMLSSADVYNNQSDPMLNAEDSRIDPETLSPYGLAKYMAEMLVMNRNKKWLVFRMGGLIGTGLRKNPVYDLLNGQPLRVSPESRFGYINTDVLARISDELIRNENIRNRVINICGDGVMSVREIAKIASVEIPAIIPDTEVITYQINNNYIKTLFKIPESRTAVLDFISDWKKQKNQK